MSDVGQSEESALDERRTAAALTPLYIGMMESQAKICAFLLRNFTDTTTKMPQELVAIVGPGFDEMAWFGKEEDLDRLTSDEQDSLVLERTLCRLLTGESEVSKGLSVHKALKQQIIKLEERERKNGYLTGETAEKFYKKTGGKVGNYSYELRDVFVSLLDGERVVLERGQAPLLLAAGDIRMDVAHEKPCGSACVHTLLDSKCSMPGELDDDGRSALHHAASARHPGSVKTFEHLLDALFKRTSSTQLARILLQCDKSGACCLLAAATCRDQKAGVSKMKTLLDTMVALTDEEGTGKKLWPRGAHIVLREVVDADGQTCLHRACASALTDTVTWLLGKMTGKKGDDLSPAACLATYSGSVPLHLAAASMETSSKEICTKLIKSAANLQAEDEEDRGFAAYVAEGLSVALAKIEEDFTDSEDLRFGKNKIAKDLLKWYRKTAHDAKVGKRVTTAASIRKSFANKTAGIRRTVVNKTAGIRRTVVNKAANIRRTVSKTARAGKSIIAGIRQTLFKGAGGIRQTLFRGSVAKSLSKKKEGIRKTLVGMFSGDNKKKKKKKNEKGDDKPALTTWGRTQSLTENTT